MTAETYQQAPRHQPKGGMCVACKKTADDCSRLDFSSMPIIQRNESEIIVRCTEFERG